MKDEVVARLRRGLFGEGDAVVHVRELEAAINRSERYNPVETADLRAHPGAV